MQSSPHIGFHSMVSTENMNPPPRGIEDIVYQLVTVGAILLVLGSVWVF